ncbi:hypothetical protein RYX36_020876 [Vicia faba]
MIECKLVWRNSAFHSLKKPCFTRGGYDTLEELLEVITWAQIGIHDKPVGLLNLDGYYNSLLSFMDNAIDDGFITPAARHIIVSAQHAQDLICKLEHLETWDITFNTLQEKHALVGTISSPFSSHDLMLFMIYLCLFCMLIVTRDFLLCPT